MKQVVVAEIARSDINSIWEYIAEEIGSCDAADAWREHINDGIQMLAVTPGIGHYRLQLAEPPVRFWRIDRYMVVYRELPDRILVARVLHEARDLENILKRNDER